ncbi:unnamed protein product [Amoebophrya sp. A25]|nr:unnamed protein product [Amoebophrya sp. A25]|eukprot:GSA25T00025657001.1
MVVLVSRGLSRDTSCVVSLRAPLCDLRVLPLAAYSSEQKNQKKHQHLVPQQDLLACASDDGYVALYLLDNVSISAASKSTSTTGSTSTISTARARRDGRAIFIARWRAHNGGCVRACAWNGMTLATCGGRSVAFWDCRDAASAMLSGRKMKTPTLVWRNEVLQESLMVDTGIYSSSDEALCLAFAVPAGGAPILGSGASSTLVAGSSSLLAGSMAASGGHTGLPQSFTPPSAPPLLAVGDSRGSVSVFEGRSKSAFPAHVEAVATLAWRPAGVTRLQNARLVTGGADGNVRIWRYQAGEWHREEVCNWHDYQAFLIESQTSSTLSHYATRAIASVAWHMYPSNSDVIAFITRGGDLHFLHFSYEKGWHWPGKILSIDMNKCSWGVKCSWGKLEFGPYGDLRVSCADGTNVSVLERNLRGRWTVVN